MTASARAFLEERQELKISKPPMTHSPTWGQKWCRTLHQRLQYDRFGFRESIILQVRKVAPLKRFTKTFILPTERRGYAAVALRQMGPQARTAIPALLEAWANDNSKVKINAVSALEAILGHKPSDGLGAADWASLEKKIISEAAQEYPKEATRLGISAITTEAVQNGTHAA